MLYALCFVCSTLAYSYQRHTMTFSRKDHRSLTTMALTVARAAGVCLLSILYVTHSSTIYASQNRSLYSVEIGGFVNLDQGCSACSHFGRTRQNFRLPKVLRSIDRSILLHSLPIYQTGFDVHRHIAVDVVSIPDREYRI